MKKEIIINSTLNEVRIAITEDNRLAEFFIELPDRQKTIGNIYYGRVNKIIQGINAAFVDIGFKQDAFLHFSDVDDSLENIFADDDENLTTFDDEEDENEDDFSFLIDTEEQKNADAKNKKNQVKAKQVPEQDNPNTVFKTKKAGDIQINLEVGQEIIVQVVREAYQAKGVKVTTRIGLPGRYVVLLPNDKSIGISRKISNFKERRRLRTLARSVLPAGFGCIIRTAASLISEDELRRDWESLLTIWREIEQKIKKSASPLLLYQDMPMAMSVIRDLFNSKIDRVNIDSKKLHKEITNYLRINSPEYLDKVELYNGKEAIFDAFGVAKDLEKTYHRKVLLQSGGSIVIEQTEAMLVIDVNSGRSVSEREQEKNAFHTNLEAIKEIARQIRLRDNGGMILIDCIDMAEERHRKKIYIEMRKELSRDRAKTVAYPLTQLNILQITRQRISQNITEKVSEICPTCQGSGRVISKAVFVNAIERWLKNFRAYSKEFRLILITNSHVIPYLTEGAISRISRLMIKYFVKIKIQHDDNIRVGEFRIFSVKQQKDITQDYN